MQTRWESAIAAMTLGVLTSVGVIPDSAAGAAVCEDAPTGRRPSSRTAPAATAAYLVPGDSAPGTENIGEIRILNENIFDLDNPEENKSLYRLANTLHIKTRPEVIRSQLLFHTGEPYSKRFLKESERLLRSNRYLREAEITTTRTTADKVDVTVCTTDVWTLNPSVSFGRGGGKNSGGIGLKEYNLLGWGTQVGVTYKSTVDRDSTAVNFADTNLFGSRYQLLGSYASNSDGYSRQLDFSQPFFALDSRRAGGIMYSSARSIESLYDRGKISAQYEQTIEHHEVFVGFSPGLQDNWVRRFSAGVVYDAHRFNATGHEMPFLAPLPPARQFTYPFFGIEIKEDDFVEARNVDQIDLVEDRYLGAQFAVRVGYSQRRFGSSASAWHVQGEFANALLASERATLLLNGAFAARIEDGERRNAQLSVESRYDFRQSEKRLLHVGFAGTVGHNLDLDNPVYLGGDNGLRGYPLRYQLGDMSALLTIEQRVFTDWYPFRLFHFGGAVFFDAGRTWGSGPSESTHLGWLRDVGLGLRIGNSRSGTGRMIHVDLAYPLDGGNDISSLQLLIEAKKGF